MGLIEKFQTLIIMGAVAIGLAVGQLPFAAEYAEYTIVPFLLLMLYGLFLTIPLRQLREAFKNIRFLGASTLINFIWTPLLGAVFLSDHPALWIGFIMLMVTPCTDWYLVFTSIAKGNVPLGASVLPINLILQVLLLPLYLLLFSGTIETISMAALIESVLLVLVVPFTLAHLTRFILRTRKEVLEHKVMPFFGRAQIVFLSLAIVAMFASQGSYLLNNMDMVYILIVPILIYFTMNYMLGSAVGRMLRFTYEDSASLHLTIIARNSPVALAIAVTAFPDQPVIALALVIGPLIELPVLAAVSQLLLVTRRMKQKSVT